MRRLVECVPNFSEGRRPDVVQALVDCVAAVPGVMVLDQEMDADHHRAVLTFVGEPEAVAEAAFAVTRQAQQLIDLRRHRGSHPRVGATDVVPFVPIQGVTMDECVGLANQVGQRIGRDLGIPVYLYQNAATGPERINLEEIRRGGLEALATRMTADSKWSPDFGPRAPHPSAGVTIVGARVPLVAYNVDLASEDLAAAKAIAKMVRASGGGLPSVKAIGLELSGRRQVQVSMNLTNFEETPVHKAFEAVKREADARGIAIDRSEIVGLVPQRALLAAAEFYLQLRGFDGSQVLETRLDQRLDNLGEAGRAAGLLSGFLESVAAGKPTPGGGSVAALAGALAAALGLMGYRVSRLSQEGLERRLEEICRRLQVLILEDTRAFDAVLMAYRQPKDDPTRGQAIARALRRATDVPLETATLADETIGLIETIQSRAKPSVKPDLQVGRHMAVSALQGGVENAEENLETLRKHGDFLELLEKVHILREKLVELKAM